MEASLEATAECMTASVTVSARSPRALTAAAPRVSAAMAEPLASTTLALANVASWETAERMPRTRFSRLWLYQSPTLVAA